MGASVYPSYKEVKQHVFAGERTLFFCSAVAKCGCLCGTSCPRRFLCYCAPHKPPVRLVLQLYPVLDCAYLPYRPVRPGPHLPQIPVPLRYFPCSFVDFLPVVTRSDSLRHPNRRISRILSGKTLLLRLVRPYRRYTLIVPDPTYAFTLVQCAVLRVSRSRAHPEVTNSHSRALLEVCN